MTLAEDQSHLLHALLRNGVEFVIVGGVAAQLRGWAGATTDLDIAVASNEIGILDIEGDDPVVIHAQPLRPKFHRFLG